MLKGFGDPVLYVMIFLAIVSLVAIQIKNLYVIPIIFGIVATAFGIWVRDPEKLISFMSGFGPQALPKIKYGLYVYIFGSFILLISGIVGLIRR